MTDTEVLIRDCLSSYAETAQLTDLVAAAKTPQPRRAGRANDRVKPHRRTRLILIGGAIAVVVLLVATFALGATHTTVKQTGLHSVADLARQTSTGGGHGGTTATTPGRPGTANGITAFAPDVPEVTPQSAAASSTGGSLGATRVVKTGSLALRVGRGRVQATVNALITLAGSFNGYASRSSTSNAGGSPYGELTLRVPVKSFDAVVSNAEKLGHETSLSTNANDVTGRFVDLGARLTALEHTRATYLTILSHATTIGATLAVQQRVDDAQSQIEQLQGQLKVLRNQSDDGTLSVDVSQVGSPLHKTHHKQSGLAKAWHNSTRRFGRGIDAIVGALGPALLALLIVGLLALIVRIGYRSARRFAR